MSLKVYFLLWYISKHHCSSAFSPLCQLWTWPGWPGYLSPPGWILPWIRVSKTGHETDRQILAGSHTNCIMLWDMSSNIQGPVLMMGQLPNTARLSLWSLSHHLSHASYRQGSSSQIWEWSMWHWGKSMNSDFSGKEVSAWLFMNIPPTYSCRSLNIFLSLSMPSLPSSSFLP